jgi:hypothetical protein
MDDRLLPATEARPVPAPLLGKVMMMVMLLTEPDLARPQTQYLSKSHAGTMTGERLRP